MTKKGRGCAPIKTCIRCGAQLTDSAAYCSGCMAKQDKTAYTIPKIEVGPEPKSTYTEPRVSTQKVNESQLKVLKEMSGRMRLAGGLGVGVATVQAVFIFLDIVIVLAFRIPWTGWWGTLFLAALCAWNYWAAYTYFKNAKDIFADPLATAQRFQGAGSFVFAIVWNSFVLFLNIISLNIFGVLVMGFGLAASIVHFAYTRAYIVKHVATLATG